MNITIIDNKLDERTFLVTPYVFEETEMLVAILNILGYASSCDDPVISDEAVKLIEKRVNEFKAKKAEHDKANLCTKNKLVNLALNAMNAANKMINGTTPEP